MGPAIACAHGADLVSEDTRLPYYSTVPMTGVCRQLCRQSRGVRAEGHCTDPDFVPYTQNAGRGGHAETNSLGRHSIFLWTVAPEPCTPATGAVLLLSSTPYITFDPSPSVQICKPCARNPPDSGQRLSRITSVGNPKP